MIEILHSSNKDFVVGDSYLKSDFLNWADSNDVPEGIIVLIGKRSFLTVNTDGNIHLQQIKAVGDPVSILQFAQTHTGSGVRMRPSDMRIIILHYIAGYCLEYDLAPRNMKIADGLDIIRTSVSQHIMGLIEDGLVDSDHYITDLGRRVVNDLC